MDRTAIGRLIDGIGTALSASDAEAVARYWEAPALVLGDGGSHAIGDIAEVTAFFAMSIPAYQKQGVITARGRLLHAEALSDTLAAIDVIWPGYDAEGREVMSETSHYLVSVGEDGEYRVRVALSRTG